MDAVQSRCSTLKNVESGLFVDRTLSPFDFGKQFDSLKHVEK